MARPLYIIAYDVSAPTRLNRVRRFLKAYSSGGQKSVFECHLTRAELREVAAGLRDRIDPKEDRVHIFPMDGRSRTHTLGIAVQPADPDFFYVG